MGNDSKDKSWLVIVIGARKRYGTFRIARKTLILLSVCLIATIITVIACSCWLSSRSCTVSNNNLTGELATARQSIDCINREKRELLSEAENLRAELETFHKKHGLLSTVEKKDELTSGSDSGGNETHEEPFVSLEQIQIKCEESDKTIKVRFIIKNEDPEGDYVSGYAFISLNPTPDGSGQYKVYPEAPLVNGTPETYKLGEYFYMARFKHMEAVFTSINDRNRYDSISIMVYASDGVLRIKRDLTL